jgi:hypothetical protein
MLQTFDENTSNDEVYKYTAQPLVKFVFHDSGRATVFAYVHVKSIEILVERYL